MRVSASLSWWMPASILSTIPTITTCTTHHHLLYLTKYDLKFSIAPEIILCFGWHCDQIKRQLDWRIHLQYIYMRVFAITNHIGVLTSLQKNALIYPLKVQNWCCDLNILGDIGQRYGCWCPGSLTGSTTSMILSMLDKRIVYTRIVCCMYTSL